MGFFDRDVKNGFDRMFDFNRDGKLDAKERGMQFAFMDSEAREGSDDEDELDDDLEMAGLDRFDLEFMDEDERRETLENAGLDPNDYDDEF